MLVLAHPLYAAQTVGPVTDDIGEPISVLVDDPAAFMKNKTAAGLPELNVGYLEEKGVPLVKLDSVLAPIRLARIGCVAATIFALAGLILLARPVQGTLTLTIVVGAYFLAEGVTTIMYALEHRRELSERWSWLLVAGLMDILVAAIIIAGLPGSALWAVGLLAGVNLLFGGAALIGTALAVRKA